ncbi:MAG TPA: hypothetical protein VFW41_11830 [Gaiellaceae bacterium]|nr:hypothetical protein [Gaiellaceae bacterium]
MADGFWDNSGSPSSSSSSGFWKGAAAPAKPSGGGGGVGGLLGSIGHVLGAGAHWTASKADLAAHDLVAMPGGAVTALDTAVVQPWKNALTTGHPYAHGAGQKIDALTQQVAQSTVAPLAHPLRDPFQTLLTVAPAANAVGRAGMAGAAAADAARTGDLAGAAKALVARPQLGPRILQVPKLVATGEEPAQLAHEPVQLVASQAPLLRLFQAAHDKLVQASLDRNATTANPSALANYAMRRVGKATSETARTAQRTQLIPTQMLERAGSSFDKGVSTPAGQLAVFLRSNQVLPDEAAAYWKDQAARGVNPGQTAKLAKLASQVHAQGMLRLDPAGKVEVNAEAFPKLAATDALTGENQATRAAIVKEHGLMTPAGMQGRLDLVGRVIAGGQHGDLPALPVTESSELGSTVRVIGQQADGKLTGITPAESGAEARGTVFYPRWNRVQTLPLSQLEHPQGTGIIGGENALPGEGYTPLKTSVKQLPQTGIARSRVPVIGKVRGFIGAKPATGVGVAKGLVPDKTTAGVARAAREALRYLGTVQHRGLVARYGSDVRRTGEDVLVADPAAEHYATEISASTNELLGRTQSTLNTISEAEHQGLAQAMRAKLEEAIPGLRDNFAADQEAQLGTPAPEGYKWVPRQALGELVKDATPRTAITKRINDVNSAVTAATVYFKLSHIPQRLTTNATTSAISGALFSPASLRAAMQMRSALSDREYAEAVAASGTHGYMALPHEGTSQIAGFASRGANFYAHRIDSPFRFLNFVHEARKAGFGTPDKFRALIDFAKSPDASAADAATMTQVLRRSNRVSMMYDGLGQNEQRILARGLWFYPWTKAAVRFAGHTIAEHPVKAYIGGQLGQLGEQRQNDLLGALPSYEYGLVPFGGGANPMTSDLAVMTPFGTAGNVAELLARPGGLIGNLNPVYGAGLTAISGVNQYGDKTTTPIGDAASQLFSPTPEAQILSAYMHQPKPTQIFHKTPKSQAVRALGGPSVPRRTNRAALAKAAAREKAGR